MAAQIQKQATTRTRIFAGDNPAKTEKLCLSQLVLSYCCGVFLILNLFLLLGTEVKGFHIDGNFLNCSGKLIVHFFIIIRYRCLIIHAYINSFIAGKSIWLRFGYFPFSDFLAVYGQNGLPAAARLTAIKYKLVFNSMFS